MAGRCPDERLRGADHRPAEIASAGVYFQLMNAVKDNQVDWTAAATPAGEGVVPSLSRAVRPKPRVLPTTKRGVLDTLLGENNLSAADAGGADPYNATGRQFRR
jgi:hypothetical protein